MSKLLFVPIKLNIPIIDFDIDVQSIDTFNGLWSTKFLHGSTLDIPFIRELLIQLPFKKITAAKFNIQIQDVPSHVDVQLSYTKDKNEYNHIMLNEPAGYRIILSGKNDKLEVFDGTSWCKASVPTTPHAYLINSTTAKHRISNETGRKILYFRGFLDERKHKEIIKLNLELFNQYAIFSN